MDAQQPKGWYEGDGVCERIRELEAQLAQAQRERDEWKAETERWKAYSKHERDLGAEMVLVTVQEHIDELKVERDEARAEVERLTLDVQMKDGLLESQEVMMGQASDVIGKLRQQVAEAQCLIAALHAWAKRLIGEVPVVTFYALAADLERAKGWLKAQEGRDEA